ncbi:MAG TPA: ATP-binding cassette domain-containing protein [bacterium]|nr:ATP-binding cassette domain-containing protein [bacterium]
MIEVKNVSKRYGSLRAVTDVSFRLEKGEVLGLLGPNGAGKTTLMRIMTGYLPASEGVVTIDGRNINEAPLAVKKQIGYLPENPPLYGDMSVKSYLQFTAEIKGVPRSQRKERISSVIEMISLETVAPRLIENLSKGYRQRVGLAQALIHNPDVLVLDEPTVGLDPHQIIEIRNLIKNLAKEHTIILSSHILPEVSATCDRVVILNEGKVVAVDTQQDLSSRIQGEELLTVEFQDAGEEDVISALNGMGNVAKSTLLQSVGGSVKASVSSSRGKDIRADLFRLAVDRGWTMLELSHQGLSLEDVFLKLTCEEAQIDE